MDFSENVSSNMRHLPSSFPKQSKIIIGKVVFIEKINDDKKFVIEVIKLRSTSSNCISFYHKQKARAFLLGLLFLFLPGGDLLSHGKFPHYHRRYGVSLLSSAWGQVGPPHYRRQDYSFDDFILTLIYLFSSFFKIKNKL